MFMEIISLIVAIDGITNIRLAVYTVHGDCHDENVRDSLRKLSDASLVLSQPNFDKKGSAKCQVTSFKTKGKNSRLVSNFNVTSSLEIKQVQEKSNKADIETDDEEDKLQTTFNLGLKISERKAKTQVQLPFWRPEQKHGDGDASIGKQKGGNGGEIFYVADDVDDCDEEDPDDELNI